MQEGGMEQAVSLWIAAWGLVWFLYQEPQTRLEPKPSAASEKKLIKLLLSSGFDQEILLDEAGGCEILACLGGSGWRRQRMVWGDLKPAQERDNQVQMHHRSVRANGEGA